MNLHNLDLLKEKRNLLAYSGGTDSNALLQSLLENNIPFDIAIVNYNTRETSYKEVTLGRSLAKKHGFDIFVLETTELTLEASKFEASARKIRHDFFKSIIKTNNYDNLITGHNLDDRLEWAIMQLIKGCGANELISLTPTYDMLDYTVVRPLIATSKNEIMAYLKDNDIEYFFDNSNLDDRYHRNYIRSKFSKELMDYFTPGIRRSFEIMDKESKPISFEYEENNTVVPYFRTAPLEENNFVKVADKLVKRAGSILSSSQREELYKNKHINFYVKDMGEFVVSYFKKRIWLTPFMREVIPKKDRDRLRRLDVPTKSRPFIHLKTSI